MLFCEYVSIVNYLDAVTEQYLVRFCAERRYIL